MDWKNFFSEGVWENPFLSCFPKCFSKVVLKLENFFFLKLIFSQKKNPPQTFLVWRGGEAPLFGFFPHYFFFLFNGGPKKKRGNLFILGGGKWFGKKIGGGKNLERVLFCGGEPKRIFKKKKKVSPKILVISKN